MNKFYAAMCVLVFLPLIAGGYNMYVEMKCKELNKEVKQLYEQDGDSKQADFSSVKDRWNKTQKLLALSVNHEIIEKINEAITRAEQWAESNETTLMRTELKWLESLINHIHEMERVSVENVL